MKTQSTGTKAQIKHKTQRPKTQAVCVLCFGWFVLCLGFVQSVLCAFRRQLFSIQGAVTVILLVVIFTLPSTASAQGGLVPCGGEGQNPCSICDLGILTINVTNFLIYNIAIPLAGLMILVGGLMIMIGAASEERVKTGKKILTNALVGIVIVFVAWLLVDTVIKVLTGSYAQRNFFGTFGPWNRIPSGACPFGGGISPTLPTPTIQAPRTEVPTAEILREKQGR